MFVFGTNFQEKSKNSKNKTTYLCGFEGNESAKKHAEHRALGGVS